MNLELIKKFDNRLKELESTIKSGCTDALINLLTSHDEPSITLTTPFKVYNNNKLMFTITNISYNNYVVIATIVEGEKVLVCTLEDYISASEYARFTEYICTRNVYFIDVNFNVVKSVMVEANSKEEALNKAKKETTLNELINCNIDVVDACITDIG